MKLADGKVTLHAGDCLEVLATLAENSIDAVVTDPPYELGFMGKSWDASGIAFNPETWRKVMRVLKPGGHIVAFGAPKNYHRLACAIEDAGFEIRDSLMWVFGSGFPKSHNIGKAIDNAAGATRKVIGHKVRGDVEKAKQSGSTYASADANKNNKAIFGYGVEEITEPATDAAREWQGWGTALKPAYEPIVLARKPLSEGTVAANVLKWGCGALNIDATRISIDGEKITPNVRDTSSVSDGWNRPWMADKDKDAKRQEKAYAAMQALGRWPANLCHSGEQEVLDLFPSQKSPSTYKRNVPMGIGDGRIYGNAALRNVQNGYGDEGSAARFFYCAKASKHDRAGSKHPTVKPINLMRWLVRMVTPPGGTVLDPFAGSGTTGLAAVLEGFDAQLIEREAEYQADIQRRFDD